MDKSLITGTILGTAIAAGGGASLHYATQPGSLAQYEPVAGQVLPVSAAPAPAAAPAVAAPVRVPPAPAPVAYRPPVQAAPPPAFARVLAVRPIEETVQTPRQQCYEETVSTGAPVRDKHQIAGIISGAVIGGVLGHQVGDGRGKDLATVAGAAAGAFGGRKVQQEVQGTRAATTSQTRCETVMETQVKVKEYDVRYEIDGQVASLRMPYDPGQRIPLSNGAPVI